jgi:hypothetical protein
VKGEFDVEAVVADWAAPFLPGLLDAVFDGVLMHRELGGAGRVAASGGQEHPQGFPQPGAVYIEETLPKNPVGKIAKPVLRERLKDAASPISEPGRSK